MNGSVSKRARHPGFRGSVAVSHSSSARTCVEMNALKDMLSRCWVASRFARILTTSKSLRQKNKRTGKELKRKA